jgi:pullulanase/glycogen debranching enzyme
MVKQLHAAGIEVILDVVYNHTGEGPQDAPAVSYRGLADSVYYTTDENGAYLDYTHCGNSLSTDAPLVRQLIHESLRYWADEMHIDGFRFDLAPTLFRKRDTVTFDHELHHMIVNDPVLSSLKLIVEPWDLGPDGYQRGRFPQPYLEWKRCVSRHLAPILERRTAPRLNSRHSWYTVAGRSSTLSPATTVFTLLDPREL